MLVDSHCHLNMLDFQSIGGDLSVVLSNAKDNHVEHMLCVGTDLKDIPEIISIAEQHAEVSASIGLHPNEKAEVEPTVDRLVSLASHSKVVAIGETGLDYYRLEGDKLWQRQRFVNHIEAATLCKKPLIVHTRQAKKDTLDILRAEKAEIPGGVLHCFTEDWETAKEALDLNFYISLSGIVTFKNANDLQKIAKTLPLDRLLIETDSPYLAPIPHRGKTNQPAYVKHIAEFIATLRGIAFEDLAAATTRNFYNLFTQIKRTPLN